MKRISITLFLVLTAIFSASAQILDPVDWSTSVEKISETEYKLISKATIDPGWHLYSQEETDGPRPTIFTYDDANGAFKIVGNTSEPEGVTEYTELFGEGMDVKWFKDSAVFEQKIEVLGDARTLTAYVEYMTCDDVRCLAPKEEELVFNLDGGAKAASTAESNGEDSTAEVEEAGTSSSKSKRGLFTLFIIAFFSGFAALLTPCVFPMIPLTVSFFTKQSKNKAEGIRNAIFYGVSIVVIYVLLGVAVSAIFGPAAMNQLASNVWFNLIFFLLLIVFAISFLGAFEITLPSSWANKVDEQSYKKGGLLGIFFMALALAIVSFSCTGPIVGTILVEAASGGDKVGPIIGMLGFSLAIALPFALFAAFPGWMNSLPKSGGWLNTVKVVLGFLELALAFKFLSTADLVLQLHIFEREIFIAIWIAVFGALALYLFGKIQLPHDSPLTHISVGRLSFGLLVLAFTIYLIPGLWGAPLKLISGFPPPLNYSESPYGVGYTKLGSGGGVAETLPKDAHYGVHDIVMFHDYDKGLAYAKQVNKPVMLDFTGWSCVNCRKMEEYVWSEPKVLETIKKEFVMVSLYVDEKRAPYEDEQGVSEYLYPGKPFKKIGDKWAELQIMRYGSNAQPLYVLMDHNEENLIEPVAYTPDVDEYHTWLEKGISEFKK